MSVRLSMVVAILAASLAAETSLAESTNSYIATPQCPSVSPSGEYVLDVLTGHNGLANHYRFEIFKIDSQGQRALVFTSTETFQARHRTIFAWDEHNRVWVYSGDIGTFFWTRTDDGLWIKTAWSSKKGESVVPKAIKGIIDETKGKQKG